jgi:hypothetical protein
MAIMDLHPLQRLKGIQAQMGDAGGVPTLLRGLGLQKLHERYLPAAGNTAHFLQKSLMLAAREFGDDIANKNVGPNQKSRISALESIARAPVEIELSTLTPDGLAFRRAKQAKWEAKKMKKASNNHLKKTREVSGWYDNLEGGIDMEVGECVEDLVGMLI